MRTARVRASSFDWRLIERVDREATRSVTPTSSTDGTDRRYETKEALVIRPGSREVRS
jgi:hypothetical protein